MRQFGIESLSSSQVSRATRLLDEELEAWRNRPLGEVRYLFLDARYEKVRIGGVVRDAAVLSAIHCPAGMPCQAAGSAASSTWPKMPSVTRQWFALQTMRGHHAPNVATAKRIGTELRAVWNASDLAKAEAALSDHHRRRLRTSNPPPRACTHALPGNNRARHPAGAQTPHRQGQGVSQRGITETPRQRRAGRNRRTLGRRHKGLHQMGMPGCLITPNPNFQTAGCVIVVLLHL